MVKYDVTPPLELSTLIAHPELPPLGAAIAHGPMTYGFEALPFPEVTHAQAWKSEFFAIVIAPWLDAVATLAPASAATRAVSALTTSGSGRRILLPPVV